MADTEIPAAADAAMRRNPPHPGRAIADGCIGRYAAEHGGEQSVSAAARRLGVSRVQLSRVIHGHGPITADLAVRLEAAGWGSASSWIELQGRYDVAQARARLEAVA